MWKCFKYYWALPFIWTWYLLFNTFFLLNSWFSQLWSLWRLIDIYYMLMDTVSVIKQNCESQIKSKARQIFRKKEYFWPTSWYAHVHMFWDSTFYLIVNLWNGKSNKFCPLNAHTSLNKRAAESMFLSMCGLSGHQALKC